MDSAIIAVGHAPRQLGEGVLDDHAGGDGVVTRFVDNDETPSGAVASVTVDDQWLLYLNSYPSDVVHLEPRYAVNFL